MPASECDRLDYFCQLPEGAGVGDWISGGFSWWKELTWGTVGEVVKGIASGPLKWLAEEVYQGVDSVLLTLTTFWVGIPTPMGQSWTDSAGIVHRYTSWLVLTLAVVSIIVAGILIIRDGRGEPLGRLVQSLITMVIASGSGVYLAGVVVQIADGTAQWIIDQAIGYSDGNFFIVVTGFASLGGGLGALVVILFGVVQIILGVIQVALMLLRTALLLLLAGTIPLAFSMTNTSWGAGWASKVVGWFLAFAVYKPAAALVYATGITITSSVLATAQDNPGDSILMLANGLMIMAAATLALPALMKLIVPAVGTMAAGSGGAVIAGGAAAAMGAKSVAGSFGGGGGEGGSGGGPSGAGGATATGGGATASGASEAATGAAAGAATGGLATAAQAAGEGVQEGAQAAEGAVNSAASQPGGETEGTDETSGSSAGAGPSGASTPSGSLGGSSGSAGGGGTAGSDSGGDTPAGAPTPAGGATGSPTTSTPALTPEDSGPSGSQQVTQ